MQRLGELNNKVIVEQKYAPENKHVIWKDPAEDKFKEFKDGQWVESEEIAVPSEGGDFPYEFIQLPDIEYTVKEDDTNYKVISHIDIDLSDYETISLFKDTNDDTKFSWKKSQDGFEFFMIGINKKAGAQDIGLYLVVGITYSQTLSVGDIVLSIPGGPPMSSYVGRTAVGKNIILV